MFSTFLKHNASVAYELLSVNLENLNHIEIYIRNFKIKKKNKKITESENYYFLKVVKKILKNLLKNNLCVKTGILQP